MALIKKGKGYARMVEQKSNKGNLMKMFRFMTLKHAGHIWPLKDKKGFKVHQMRFLEEKEHPSCT